MGEGRAWFRLGGNGSFAAFVLDVFVAQPTHLRVVHHLAQVFTDLEKIGFAALCQDQQELMLEPAADKIRGPNGAFQRLQQEALSLYKVYPVPFSAICVSIDGLPKIRERFGQAAVEATLRMVARRPESCCDSARR